MPSRGMARARPSTISAAIASNASRRTGPDGLAAHHSVGTSPQPLASAAVTKPARPTLTPRVFAITASLRHSPGQPPPSSKAWMPALLGAKVLVSCRKPPTPMRSGRPRSPPRLPAVTAHSRRQAHRRLGACQRSRRPRRNRNHARSGIQKGARVGVLRGGEDLGGGALLDDDPALHDHDAIADLGRDPEVVRDEQHGEVETPLDVVEEVQDLRLHRDVEGRDGLVGDQHLRLHGESAGNGDALALAAGELMRVAVEHLRRKPDHLQAAAARGSRPSARSVSSRRFMRMRNSEGPSAALPSRAAAIASSTWLRL